MHDIHASPESCSHSISRLLKDCVTTQPFLVQQTVIQLVAASDIIRWQILRIVWAGLNIFPSGSSSAAARLSYLFHNLIKYHACHFFF